MNTEFNSDAFLPKGSVNPFTVPEGYFDKLPSEISGRLPVKSSANSWSFLKGFPLSQSLGMLLVTLSLSMGFFLLTPSAGVSTGNLTAEAILKSDYLNEIDESIIMEAIPSAKASETIDYLMNQEIDIQQINNIDNL